MTPEEYARYCRAWQAYLELVLGYGSRTHKSQRFRAILQDHVRPGCRVQRWPTVWPAAEYLFDGDMKFTVAVETALHQLEAEDAVGKEPESQG